MVLASAILGLVKMRLYAGVLGAGLEFDTFVAAFKIPDFIFQLIVAGSLNVAFIPIFSEYIGKSKAEDAWRFASNILNLSLLLFLLLSALIFVFARPFSVLVAAGFTPEQVDTLVGLMRIMLLSPVFLGVSSFISGSIQSFRRFLVPFLSPIVYNLGAIFGILVLYRPLGLAGLAWGVVLGALFHLLIQLPLLKHLGFRYFLTLNLKDKIVQKMVRLSFPRTLGLAAEQIKGVILVNLASLLQAGSISFLRFGESIQTVPVSVIGVAIAQASLPALSQQAGVKDSEKFRQTLMSCFHQILYLLVPISVVLIVLKIPVVRLVLGIGRFDWTATVLTSWVLALFSISLFAQGANNLFVRAFYALQDTATPVAVSIVSVIVSIGLAALFMPFWQVKGLVLGVSAGALLEFLLLLLFLDKKVHFDRAKLIIPAAKIFFSAFVMAVAIYVPTHILDQVFIDTTRVVNLVILVWLVLSFGTTTYLLLTWFLGCKEIRVFLKVLLRIKSVRDSLLSILQVPKTEV